MREIHGVADAMKMQSGPEPTHKVTVTDAEKYVILNIADATYPAGLTPDRARFIATLLTASADRVEGRLTGQTQESRR
jgi:hypothetical protein